VIEIIHTIKENKLEIFFTIIMVIVVISVGFLVLKRIDITSKYAESFCEDKEGIYNMSFMFNHRNITEEINCSGKYLFINAMAMS